MDVYDLHGIGLAVNNETDVALNSLLSDMSFTRRRHSGAGCDMKLSVRSSGRSADIPAGGREMFDLGGLRGLVKGEEFCLTDGASWFRVRASRNQAEAALAPEFSSRPALHRQRFLGFGIVKLLRSRGLFGLHAAGIADAGSTGVLIVGESGCGKSSLAMGLIREGWKFLSDDALLLRRRQGEVEALALRKPFSLATVGAPNTAKHRLDIREQRPDQYMRAMVPRIVLFPEIVGEHRSELVALDRTSALQRLLDQSGPQLFDAGSMPEHMAVLNELIRQCTLLSLSAGSDLHHQPAGLCELLNAWQG